MIELDLTGLNCPIPVLKTKKLLATMVSGQQLRVITSDPAAKVDLQDFCRKSGNHLIEQYQEQDLLITIIERR